MLSAQRTFVPRWGAAVARLTVGERFGSVGVQGEAELFLLVSIGFGFLLSLWATVLEEVSFRRYPAFRDFLLLLWFSVIEAFGYRQVTLWFRLQSYWKYVLGDLRWGAMEREGFERDA